MILSGFPPRGKGQALHHNIYDLHSKNQKIFTVFGGKE
jgi:hypothetical protein